MPQCSPPHFPLARTTDWKRLGPRVKTTVKRPVVWEHEDEDRRDHSDRYSHRNRRRYSRDDEDSADSFERDAPADHDSIIPPKRSRFRDRGSMSGSENGSDHGGHDRGGRGSGPGDLASRTLVLESKRFYLDVKENTRGRFIKIAEISADGRKNQILMTLPTAAQFRSHLESFIEAYADMGPVDPNHLAQGELKSEVMFKEDKKYHIDLKVTLNHL